MTIMLTVSIWHNVTRDPGGRHAGFAGFTPGDQMVKVFTYDTPVGGRSPAAGIAEDAFAAYAGTDLVRDSVLTHGDYRVARRVH